MKCGIFRESDWTELRNHGKIIVQGHRLGADEQSPGTKGKPGIPGEVKEWRGRRGSNNSTTGVEGRRRAGVDETAAGS